MRTAAFLCTALFATSALAQPAATLPANLAPQAAPPIDGDGYQLVWSDEFTRDGAPDARTWTFEKGFVRNNEHQWYQPENATCKAGILTIEARRETKPNPNYDAAAPASDWRRSRKTIEYTASSMTTSASHDWLFGRFELRAKIDTRAGSWPAFWALGRGRWPAAGEIDIMEYYREMLLFNVAWQGPTAIVWNSVREPLAKHPNFAKEFHTWRLDWDEKVMAFYLDGKLANVQDLTKTVNGGRGRMAGQNPFHAPQYLLINLAIGGDNGGDPAKTEFPVRYEVDYVRVYQKPGMDKRAGAGAAATRPAR